jgi:hypothetical protein
MYRIKSTLVVLFDLSLALVSFPQLEELKAEGTIYVRPDGGLVI